MREVIILYVRMGVTNEYRVGIHSIYGGDEERILYRY
jgi:hypothetical protein